MKVSPSKARADLVEAVSSSGGVSAGTSTRSGASASLARASSSGGSPSRRTVTRCTRSRGDVGDVAVDPEPGIAIERQPSLGEPGLVLAGAADEGGLRHIALGADAAAADDERGDRRRPGVEHAQQRGGGAGLGGVIKAEPSEQRRVGGARFGQAQLGQADEQFAHRSARAG